MRRMFGNLAVLRASAGLTHGGPRFQDFQTRQAVTCFEAADSGTFRCLKSFAKSHLLTFGRNLARLREAGGLTQEKVAEQVDLSGRHYQKLEAGSVTPTFGVLISLRRALRCTWADLFKSIE